MKYNTNIKGISDDERAVLEALNNRDSRNGFTINPFSAIAKQQASFMTPLKSGVTPLSNKFLDWLNADYTNTYNKAMEDEFNKKPQANNVARRGNTPKVQSVRAYSQRAIANNQNIPMQTVAVPNQISPQQVPQSELQYNNIDNNLDGYQQIGDLLTGSVEENSTANPTNNVMEYYRSREQDMAPYLDQLKNFIDNYGKYNRVYDDLDTYYRGLAGWTGNNAWANYAQAHNPVDMEKARLGLYNELAKAQIENKDKLYEIVANEQMARALGLPEGATLANKELTKQFGQMNRLEKTLDWKRESKKIDEFIKQKELEYKYWMTNQNNARARDVANIISNARRYQADMNYKIYGNNDNSNSSVSGLYGDGKSNI